MDDFALEPLPSSILTNQKSREVSNAAIRKAVEVMIIGSVPQANRIIELLYHYNFISSDTWGIIFFRTCLHFAWAQSNRWPPFILETYPNKPMVGPGVGGIWGDSEETLQKMDHSFIPSLSIDLRDKFPYFDDADLNYAITEANAAGGDYNFQWLGAAVQIALKLQHHNTAEDLLQKYTAVFTGPSHHDSLDICAIGSIRDVWPSLSSGFFAQALSIGDAEIADHVDRILDKLTERFENGPANGTPFKDHTMKDLVALLDKTWLEIDALEDGCKINNNCNCDRPKTFTHQGLTNQQLLEFEKRLDIALPDDFIEFLSATDEFYSEDPTLQNNIFTNAANMDWKPEYHFPRHRRALRYLHRAPLRICDRMAKTRAGDPDGQRHR